jgi:hypothetical protein
MIKKLTRWKICPEKGGQICLVGKIGNDTIQTTSIVAVNRAGGNISFRTRSGTIYECIHSEREGSMWELQLQVKRPEKYNTLQALHVV